MATTDVRTTARRGPAPSAVLARHPIRDLRRSAILLGGGIALILLVKPIGSLPYFWVPAISGTIFLLAAAVEGKTSSLWPPALAVSGWGWAHVISGYFTFGLNTAAPMQAGSAMMSGAASHSMSMNSASAGSSAIIDGMLGLAILGLALMARRGFTVSVASIGTAIVFIAAGEFIHGTWGSWITPAFCILIGGWGLWEISKTMLNKTVLNKTVLTQRRLGHG